MSACALRVPARLDRRDLTMDVVAAACRLVGDSSVAFASDVVAAVVEVFNDVVKRARAANENDPEILIEIEPRSDRLTIRLHGATPIARLIVDSTMDDVSYYRANGCNVLAMTKRLR